MPNRQIDKLKTIARELGAKPAGDRRKIQTWELAHARQAQIMDIPIDAAYNPIFRTSLLGGRNRLSFEVIEQALGFVEHQCYPRLHGPIQEPIVNSPGAQLAAKVFPGIACFQNLVELAAEKIPGVDCVQEPIELAVEKIPGVDQLIEPVLEFAPADNMSKQLKNIYFKVDTGGQLSLLDFEVVEVELADELLDFDDFEFLDASCEAIALWDFEHCQQFEVSLDSFREWAPCFDDWYEPSEVLELSRAIESSITCNFSIPTFGAVGDRTNRSPDEPPTAGVGARLPKPKPPDFPPMAIIAGDRANHIRKFARSGTLLSGRSPPGGDAAM